MADGGTLFLDEIGDMDVALQAKLLKVIEDQTFRRIGGNKEITVNVAIIAATNQNVEQQLLDGSFRADLYYRLNVIPLRIPPLRERREDIKPLCAHFIFEFSRKLGKHIAGFSTAAMEALMTYSWPGNVRELRNVVERGCILTSGPHIDDLGLLFPHLNSKSTPPPASPAALPAPVAESQPASSSPAGPARTLEDAEREAILNALAATSGKRQEAAEILGIHRTTLYKKLQVYGMEHL